MKNLLPVNSLLYSVFKKSTNRIFSKNLSAKQAENKNLLILLFVNVLLFFATNNTIAQPNQEWLTVLGGSGSEFFYDIKQTSDGGYITCGFSESSDGDVGGNNGLSDYWIIKTDATGQLDWETNVGGSEHDRVWRIALADDGYVFAGNTASSDGDISGASNGGTDWWIVKLNLNGNLVWETNLGGSGDESIGSIQATSDGGYIIAGSSNSSDGDVGVNRGDYDAWVVKLNAAGILEWSRIYGGSKEDGVNVVHEVAGGYILGGDTRSEDGDISSPIGSSDIWIIKINTVGDIVWEKTFGGTNVDEFYDLKKTSDGGFITTLYSYSTDMNGGGGLNDCRNWVVKLDADGEIEWTETPPNTSCFGGFGYTSILPVEGGKYILLDYAGTLHQLDAFGNKEWEMEYTNPDYSIFYPFQIQQTNDNGLVLAGFAKDTIGGISNFEGMIQKLEPLPVVAAPCSGDLAGYTTIGTFNNSKYYISNEESRPTDAQNMAAVNGGNLVIITSQAENDFIQQNISGLVYIGLNDADTEGELTWVNGDAISYNNINPCGYCSDNQDDQDFAVMQSWDGGWSFSNFYNERKYVIEVACGSTTPPTNECTFKSTIQNLPFNNDYEQCITETNNGFDIQVTADFKTRVEIDFQGQYMSNLDVDFLYGLPSNFTLLNFSKYFPYVFAYENNTNEVALVDPSNNFFGQCYVTLPNGTLPPPDLKIFETENEVLIMGTRVVGGSGFYPFVKSVQHFTGNQNWDLTIGYQPSASAFGKPFVGADGKIYISYLGQNEIWYIAKLNYSGNIEWEIPTTGVDIEQEVSIVGETSDGSALYYFLLKAEEPIIYKINTSDGSLIWEKNLDLFLGPNEQIYYPYMESAVITLEDGIVAGFQYSVPNIYPKGFAYGKIDEQGNLVWEKRFENSELTFQLATSDGGYLLTEADFGNFYIQKMTSQGELEPSCLGYEPSDLNIRHVSGWWSSTSSSKERGEIVSLEYDLFNEGLDAVQGSYDINFYLSTDFVLDNDDVQVASISRSDTPVGFFNNQPAEFQIPNSIPLGSYRLIAVIDDGDNIFEINEFNNEYKTTAVEIIDGNTGTCPNDLQGFISLGEFGSSKYFLSETAEEPETAATQAIQNGGYLTTISSQAENDFIANQLTEMAYIGLNDFATEGEVVWKNGDAVSFTNFDFCSFCNENSMDLDFVMMHNWNGGWSWSNFYNRRKYIVEIPCTSTISNSNLSQNIGNSNSNTTSFGSILLGEIYPNPATNEIFITIDTPMEQEVDLQIFDARGVLVKTKTVSFVFGKNKIQMDIDELPKGMYSVFIPQVKQGKTTLRFVK